jgi:hypothetical protein
MFILTTCADGASPMLMMVRHRHNVVPSLFIFAHTHFAFPSHGAVFGFS